jgi:TRAP-type transport system small permease protein
MNGLLRMLVTLERVASVLLLLAVLSLMSVQVVARYVFNAPFFWTDELARYCYVWLSFVAAVFLTAERDHIGIDLLDRLLSPRILRAVKILAGLIVIAACLLLVIGSWPWLMTTVRPTSSALRMPLVWLYGVVWVSFIMIAFHTAVNLLRDIVEPEPAEATDDHQA